MKPRRLHSDTSLSITSGWVLAGMAGWGWEWSANRSGPRGGGTASATLRAAGCGRITCVKYAGIRAPRCSRARPAATGPAEQVRDDPVAVEAAVLDEDLVRVVARDHHAGDVHARHGRLERRRVVRRDAGRRRRSARPTCAQQRRVSARSRSSGRRACAGMRCVAARPVRSRPRRARSPSTRDCPPRGDRCPRACGSRCRAAPTA